MFGYAIAAFLVDNALFVVLALSEVVYALPSGIQLVPLCSHGQVGRAGRFGTKGLAITFVSSQEDSAVLNAVQDRFDVDIKPLPEKIDASTYMNTN